MTMPWTGRPAPAGNGAPAPGGNGVPPQGGPPAPAAGLDPNMRIGQGDSRFPPELWGKTLGEAMRYYAVMREDFVRRNSQPTQPPLAGQPPQGAPMPAPAAPPAPRPAAPPVYGAQPVPAAGAPPQGYFSREDVERLVDERVRAAVAPSRQITIQQVYDQVKRTYGDWNQYEQDIFQALQGAPEENLLNPELWRTAYFTIKGRKLTESRAPRTLDAPTSDANGGHWAPPPAPPGVEPGSYFTEGPTPSPTRSGPYEPNEDPQDELYARRFGISIEEYRAWKGGRIPPMRTPGQANGAPGTGAPASSNGGGW